MLVLLLIGTGWDLHRAAQIRRQPRVPDRVADRLPEVDSSTPKPDTPQAQLPEARPTVVDLNRATLAELDALPGIGPVLARRILEHRGRHGPLRTVDELRAVPGIGPSLLDRLRGLVRAGSAADDREAGRAERNPPGSKPEPLFPSR